MSIMVFSGSAQFAVAGVIGSGGSVGAAVVAAALVNARFIPMSVAVTPFLRGKRFRRALEAQTVVDAGWALSRSDDGTFDRQFLIGFFAAMVPAWVGGTVVGTLIGDRFGDLERFGLDAVFPAFFLALLTDELRDRDSRRVAIIAAVIAIVLLPIAPAGVPVILASSAIL
jgi:predicted branched-subunit amino acid permease